MPGSQQVTSAPVKSNIGVHPEGAGTLPPKNTQDHALDSPFYLCCPEVSLVLKSARTPVCYSEKPESVSWTEIWTRRVETKVGAVGSHTRQQAWCLFPFQCTGAECRIWVCYAMFYHWVPSPSRTGVNGSQNISNQAFPFSKNIIPSQNRTSSCHFGELHLKIYVHVCASKLQELKTPLHTDRANSINLLCKWCTS